MPVSLLLHLAEIQHNKDVLDADMSISLGMLECHTEHWKHGEL